MTVTSCCSAYFVLLYVAFLYGPFCQSTLKLGMYSKNVATNLDRAKLKGTMAKWPVQKQIPRTARDTQYKNDATLLKN